MNALYTHALRQTQSITQDLAMLESSLRPPTSPNLNGEGTSNSANGLIGSPSLQGNGVDTTGLNGQIVASLAALQRTVEDYDNMARRELVEANKGKAASRVERIRNDYNELKKQYDRLKQSQATQRTAQERAALFSSSINGPGGGATAMNQRRLPQQPSTMGTSESPFSLPPRNIQSNSRGSRNGLYTPNNRTDAALDEHSFIKNSGNQLDMFIAQGQAVLGNLGNQRDVLKSTQRRLLSAANTLGLSRNTINFIERRGRGDMAVFIGGSITTLICFVLILKYLG